MRKSRLSIFLGVLVLSLVLVSGLALAPRPVNAAVTCPRDTWRLDYLISNAWMYDRFFDPKVHIKTLSRGRGFRIIAERTDYDNRKWVCGYSAEFPGFEGWILDKHLCIEC